MNHFRSSQDKKRKFVTKILSWYDIHKSSFPWRKTRDPYRVLVSEILLRKTTRKQVNSIYKTFFKKFPTIRRLSLASKEELEEVITPLGMEKIRAKLLLEMATDINELHNGRIPLNTGSLLDLPGVGRYISNAVMLFMKNERVPLVDTNSMRVVERVFDGSNSKNHRINNIIENFISNLLPQKRYLDFNLALLDFASKVCLSRNPRCDICPVQLVCSYYKGQKSDKQIFNKYTEKIVSK